MVHIDAITETWNAGPLVHARTFFERWRGIALAPRGHGIVLRASAVHGLHLVRPLTVIAVDRSRRVVATGVLRPGGRFARRRVAHILELPAIRPAPPVGSKLEFRRRVAPCPACSTSVPPR